MLKYPDKNSIMKIEFIVTGLKLTKGTDIYMSKDKNTQKIQ